MKAEADVLAMRQDGWTPERVELVKRAVCPKGITDDEFLLFMEQCKRSGLDPLIKEAFCVPRRQNIGNRDQPKWITKHEFQPSEMGMLARAERFPDFRGVQATAVYQKDECTVDTGSGQVTHKFSPATDRGDLFGAWARVEREGRSPIVVWLTLAGYIQESPLWRKMPATMIEKCARVAALRKAYPSAFGGMYIAEEKPEEDTETEVRPVVSQVDQVRKDLQAKGIVIDQQADETEEQAKARHSAPLLLVPGPKKGTPLHALTFDDLTGAIDWSRDMLKQRPNAKNSGELKAHLRELEQEFTKREEVAPLSDAPMGCSEAAEPGAEG
jgi:phage recombination protein Bet